MSPSSLSVTKASQATAARIGQNIARGNAVVSGALSVREVYVGGASDRSIARGYVSGAMTTIAFFGGPYGAGAALLYSVGDALGAFDWIYDAYSNSHRIGDPVIDVCTMTEGTYASGNLLGDGEWSYQYDAMNRLRVMQRNPETRAA